MSQSNQENEFRRQQTICIRNKLQYENEKKITNNGMQESKKFAKNKS